MMDSGVSTGPGYCDARKSCLEKCAEGKRLLSAGNQTISVLSLAIWIQEPIKMLLHLASLAKGSLHRAASQGAVGSKPKTALFSSRKMSCWNLRKGVKMFNSFMVELSLIQFKRGKIVGTAQCTSLSFGTTNVWPAYF